MSVDVPVLDLRRPRRHRPAAAALPGGCAAARPGRRIGDGLTVLHRPARNPATAVTAAARSRPTEVSLPAAVAQALAAHQRRWDGDECSIANAEALTAGRATCIITGQQAGLLGGPVYTAYKIATAVRLAQQAAERTGRRCVPVFWLASEDHDIGEANHTFGTSRTARSAASPSAPPAAASCAGCRSMPRWRAAWHDYFDHLLPAGDRGDARAPYAPDGEATYTGWVARSWMRLFAGTGLVIVEPELLRPACGELFERALRARAAVAETLTASRASCAPPATGRRSIRPTAGTPFRVGPDGTRVRVRRCRRHAAPGRRGSGRPVHRRGAAPDSSPTRCFPTSRTSSASASSPITPC